MAAGGTDRQVLGTNRAHFVELSRIAPYISKLLSPHIAAGQRELDAGEDVPVRGDVGKRVARAARITVHNVFVRRRRRSAELFDISHQAFVLKYSLQF